MICSVYDPVCEITGEKNFFEKKAASSFAGLSKFGNLGHYYLLIHEDYDNRSP